MSFKELTKVANKLDSLGLTKEADILDQYIRKYSGFTPFGEAAGMGDYRPPADIAALINKWLDYVSISSVMVTNSEAGAQQCFDEIVSLVNFVDRMADGDETKRAGLRDWYTKNIETMSVFSRPEDYHNILADDMIELADDLEERLKEFPNGTWDISTGKPLNLGRYNTLAKSLRLTAQKWMRSLGQPAKNKEVPSSPMKSDAPVAQVGGATYTPYKEPKSNLTGWDKYMAKTKYGPSVKRAWEDFVKTDPPEIGVDPSFAAFTEWYKNRLSSDWGGQHKTPEEVVKLINLHKKLIERDDFTSPIV